MIIRAEHEHDLELLRHYLTKKTSLFIEPYENEGFIKIEFREVKV